MFKNKFHTTTIIPVCAAIFFLLSACNSATNNDIPAAADVTIQFATDLSVAAKSISSGQSIQTGDTLTISGSNGQLMIHDLRFIVEDFELERTDSECGDVASSEDEDCEEFKSDPFFVDLPLNADTLNLNTSSIEPGLYEELEFEIDDLDLDEEEEGEDRTVKQELAALVRNEFPDWPNEASMVVSGSFISSNGDTTDYMIFAEAEVEIELEFNPPLEISENSIDKLLRINIDPVSWFTRPDGTVLDLSVYDYTTTQNVLEFEVEIENGFKEIEIDEEDDEDDSETEEDED